MSKIKILPEPYLSQDSQILTTCIIEGNKSDLKNYGYLALECIL